MVGTIHEKKIEGHPTFLNVGVDHPDAGHLTVIAWEKDRAAFRKPPEDRCAGKTIRVTGKVVEYQKATAIEVSSPDAIEVLDEGFGRRRRRADPRCAGLAMT